MSPAPRQRAARAAHTAPYSRQHVQGCVRGPQGRAGDPLPPVPDVQGERGGAQFLAQELQEDESREPRDAHLDQRGERRAGWHGGPLRYVADIRLDIETHASNSRGPSAVALFAASTRHPLHGSPRSIVANLEAFLADDARAEDFSHPSHPQISEWRRSFRWRVWTKRRLRRKSPPCSSRGAEEERRRVYDNNPTDRLERSRSPARPREKKTDDATRLRRLRSRFLVPLHLHYTPLRAYLHARLRLERAPLTKRPFSGRRRPRARRPSPPQTPP